MFESVFFDNWQSIVRTLIVSVFAYAALVTILRVSGNRTLSKMNAFDLIVTVALGSTLATILLNKSVSLAEGVLALSLLVGLQYVVTWSSVRWKSVRQVVTGVPVMLLCRGRMNEEAMQQQRVTAAEIRAAVRQAGYARLEGVEAVVLETDGTLSVVAPSEHADDATSLSDVQPRA
jgi:uncharacterized membrane protein YcaP (DUF421 family)